MGKGVWIALAVLGVLVVLGAVLWDAWSRYQWALEVQETAEHYKRVSKILETGEEGASTEGTEEEEGPLSTATVEIVDVGTEGGGVSYVAVRNLGIEDLTGTWRVYVNGRKCYESPSPETIPADGFYEFDTDEASPECQLDQATNHVKVTGPQGAVAETYVTP